MCACIFFVRELKVKIPPLPLLPIGTMEEWSLPVLLTSLSQMLPAVWDVLTGSLEAALQLLFTLAWTRRQTYRDVQNKHSDTAKTKHNTSLWRPLQSTDLGFLEKKTTAELFTWTELRPSRLSHLTDASVVPTSPSLEEHATPGNQEMMLKKKLSQKN